MTRVEAIIAKAKSLPAEDRARIVSALLEFLNTPEPKIDKLWATDAQRRLAELRSGEVKAIPIEEVFRKARDRFRG